MIKEGDKIYEVEYDSARFTEEKRRHIRSYTIAEYKDGIIHVKGTAWRITLEEVGRNYYLSKTACIQGAIRNNLRGALENYDDWEIVKEMCKEITALCNLLKNIEKKEDL